MRLGFTLASIFLYGRDASQNLRMSPPSNFSLEKNQVPRVGNDSNIPILPGGSMKFILWKLKMSYHTAYPS